MGTSTSYKWSHHRRISKPILTAEPASRELTQAVADAADKLCRSLQQPRWQAGMTEPLVESVSSATARMSDTMNDIIEGSRRWPSDSAELAELTSIVCGELDGVHDTAIRRAWIATVEQLDVEVQAQFTSGLPLSEEIFCLIYQVFHIEVLTELLLHLMGEVTLPGLSTILLRTELGEWAAERVVKLLPNPCNVVNTRESSTARGARLASQAIESLIEGHVSGLEDA